MLGKVDHVHEMEEVENALPMREKKRKEALLEAMGKGELETQSYLAQVVRKHLKETCGEKDFKDAGRESQKKIRMDWLDTQMQA